MVAVVLSFITVGPMPLGMDGSEIDFNASSAKIFHLGYLLLLDELDKEDPEYGTKAAALLAKARAAGMKTSIDVVSEDSDRFYKIIAPALKQVDYCILNEVEASRSPVFRFARMENFLRMELPRPVKNCSNLGCPN